MKVTQKSCLAYILPHFQQPRQTCLNTVSLNFQACQSPNTSSGESMQPIVVIQNSQLNDAVLWISHSSRLTFLSFVVTKGMLLRWNLSIESLAF